jgi:hypothetical protein
MVIDTIYNWMVSHRTDANIYALCVALIVLAVLLYVSREDGN